MQDFIIETSNGNGTATLDLGDSLLNNIFISITYKQGSCFWNKTFGSRLHLIKKVTDDNVRLAKNYCDEALRWIVDSKRASSIEIVTEKDESNRDRIIISGTIIKADNQDVPFSLFYSVI